MEIRDGFIIGVYNYCDRRCERCPFAARCHVFADVAEHEFERDHGPLTEPMADRQARALAEHVSRWEKELGVDFAEIEREVEKNPEAYEDPDIRLEHLELDTRAQDFGHSLWRWIKKRDQTAANAADPIEVLCHFAFFVPSKIHRALHGLAEDGVLEPAADAYGSAKAALLGLERMGEAWEQLVTQQFVLETEAAPFVVTNGWLISELDRLIPQARAFIRPGFDEPDEVRRLEEEEQIGRR